MKNGDYIRNMDNDRLARFLFNWSINAITSFFEAGGSELMHAVQLRNWLEDVNFKCRETYIDKDTILNDDFTLKAVSE